MPPKVAKRKNTRRRSRRAGRRGTTQAFSLRGHLEPSKEVKFKLTDFGLQKMPVLLVKCIVVISSSYVTMPQVTFYESTSANAPVAVRNAMVVDKSRTFRYHYPRSWGWIDQHETTQVLLRLQNLCLNKEQTPPDGFLYYHATVVVEELPTIFNPPCTLYEGPREDEEQCPPLSDMAVINKSGQPIVPGPSSEADLSESTSSLSVIQNASDDDLVDRIILRLCQLGIIDVSRKVNPPP